MPGSFRLLLPLALAASLAAARPAGAEEGDFATWLQGFRADALAAGIQPATLDLAFDGLEPLPRVVELDRRQPESTQTYEQYLHRVVSPERVQAAREHFARDRALLTQISRRYGVQPRFIVALWGIEASFGAAPGKTPVIGALATLAFDGRRSTFFRSELIDALKIVEQDGIAPKDMLGSWAGAMGQVQFMPSTFLLYAQSYGGDAPPDIWHRREDVFASIANYLWQSGWHDDQSWGRAVRIPAGLDPALIGPDTLKPLAEWRKLGIRRSDGGPLPVIRDIQASLLRPGGSDGPALLAYDNFRVLLKWNKSSYFASAIGFLADGIEGH